MTFTVTMQWEPNERFYIVQVINQETGDAELTEFFPEGGWQGRAWTQAKKRKIQLRDEYTPAWRNQTIRM